jgi:hypothetical protein
MEYILIPPPKTIYHFQFGSSITAPACSSAQAAQLVVKITFLLANQAVSKTTRFSQSTKSGAAFIFLHQF